MRIKHTLLYVLLLAGLSACIQSVGAYPICLKKDMLFKDAVVYSNINIDKYFEICPWCEQNKVELIHSFLFKIQEKKVDYMTSVLSFLLGERLQHSDSLENKILGQQYIQYSFDLAYKHGITTEQHLKIFTNMD